MVSIHSSAIVEPGAVLGEDIKIWHFAHIREHAVVGSYTQIGKDVYVDTGVIIGQHCKIQNSVSIYNGVTLDDYVFIGPNVTFTNDIYPRAFGAWSIRTTHIEFGASIGAGAIIIAGVNGTTVGRYAMVGAGAVVTGNVAAHALVYGNPARQHGWVCANGHPHVDIESIHRCTQCTRQ